jgi:hypothetical protein
MEAQDIDLHWETGLIGNILVTLRHWTEKQYWKSLTTLISIHKLVRPLCSAPFLLCRGR